MGNDCCLNDDSNFVVYSSLISLADLEENTEKVVKLLTDKLKDTSIKNDVLLRVHYALYKLDSSYDVDHLLENYSNSRDYRDRCSILNLLNDGCRRVDVINVKDKLKNLVNPSDFKSVLSEYEHLLASNQS